MAWRATWAWSSRAMCLDQRALAAIWARRRRCSGVTRTASVMIVELAGFLVHGYAPLHAQWDEGSVRPGQTRNGPA
jgi:hypothetical protein